MRGLHGALLAAKVAGHSHVNLDGTLIATDRVDTPGRDDLPHVIVGMAVTRDGGVVVARRDR